MLDLVIIGGSAAGSAASIYAARRNLNFVVVAKDTGGEVALSGDVDNWPGVIHTTGIELAQQFTKHMKSYNAPIDEGFEVSGIQQKKSHYIVTAKNYSGKEKIYETKAIILATGIHPRSLGIPGEQELRGKGVTYCTVCDGPLYRNKVTATIGAGNAALESALMMSELATSVYVLTKYPEDQHGGFPKGEDILVEKLKAKSNVTIIYNADTKQILGEDKVSGIRYLDTATQKEQDIMVDGVMVHIGMLPNSSFTDLAEKNQQGELVVDLTCKTNRPGMFAAGDVTNIPFKQIAIAAGMGVTAALSAIDYINRWKE